MAPNLILDYMIVHVITIINGNSRGQLNKFNALLTVKSLNYFRSPLICKFFLGEGA